jgi:hypothetical protein
LFAAKTIISHLLKKRIKVTEDGIENEKSTSLDEKENRDRKKRTKGK